MKHNDIEEMIDLVRVEPSDKPDYQGALDRLKSIDLDYVARKLSPEQLENVSNYSIHDYPTLEMMSDIETLQKLIDSTINQQSNSKTSDEFLIKYEEFIKNGYCDDCNELNCLDSNASYRLLEIIKKYQKALDKTCRIFDEEVHNCDFLLIRNNLCDSKCVNCDQEKRVELMKEWCMSND